MTKKISSDIRKYFPTVKMVKHWHRQSTDAVKSSSLNVHRNIS